MFEDLERRLLQRGLGPVAGLDEAGRGPLAGPVTVGISIFSEAFFQAPAPPQDLSALTDSKKLSPRVRERLFAALPAHCSFGAAVHLSSKRVDQLGINPAIEAAILCALRRAEAAGCAPRSLLVDGNYRLQRVRRERPELHIESVVKGDSRAFSIAAASIYAKVSRDRRMLRFARLYPGYGFESHKGYGSAAHRAAIRERGPCPIHRRSYSW